MKPKLPVAVIGASGYSGEELVRILLGHPYVELTAITSRQYAGKSLTEVFPRLEKLPKAEKLQFVQADVTAISPVAEAVFLALPHGVAAEYAIPLIKQGKRVLDLSADFRLRDPKVYQEFYSHTCPAPELLSLAVYGLPEIYREKIRTAQLVACPGCYPTSILLPLIPLLQRKLLDPASIIVASLSGVSGAGRKTEVDYLFCECNESVRPYGVPKHRHLSEIEQELSIAANQPVTIQFVPHLVPTNRGIVSTIFAQPIGGPVLGTSAQAFLAEVTQTYQNAYKHEPFVRLLGDKRLPDTKHVIGTNYIDIAWRIDPRTGKLIIMSAIDNLIKGASGQAVQCMNIAYNLDETLGLA